jgi:hypothetical protein
MKIIKTSQAIDLEDDFPKISKRENRFRGSIFVDIWVNDSGNKEQDLETAKNQLEKIRHNIPSSYVGDVWLYQNSSGHFYPSPESQ